MHVKKSNKFVSIANIKKIIKQINCLKKMKKNKALKIIKIEIKLPAITIIKRDIIQINIQNL